MARKKAVRRENGRGTVEKASSKKNTFRAKVAVGELPKEESSEVLAKYKISQMQIFDSYSPMYEFEEFFLAFAYNIFEKIQFTFSLKNDKI